MRYFVDRLAAEQAASVERLEAVQRQLDDTVAQRRRLEIAYVEQAERNEKLVVMIKNGTTHWFSATRSFSSAGLTSARHWRRP